MIVMLRASGPNLDVDACLQWLPAARLDALWRPGDLRAGKPIEMGGFNLLLADADDATEALLCARRELSLIKGQVRSLLDSGSSASVDIGVDVFQDAPQFVAVDADFLVGVMEAGARLVFSAYPCSDDDE